MYAEKEGENSARDGGGKAGDTRAGTGPVGMYLCGKSLEETHWFALAGREDLVVNNQRCFFTWNSTVVWLNTSEITLKQICLTHTQDHLRVAGPAVLESLLIFSLKCTPGLCAVNIQRWAKQGGRDG